MIAQNLLLSLLFLFFQACNADSDCIPSACGPIRNISFPFRLKNDADKCGKVEVECENDVASVHLKSQKYHVKDINYTTQRIRIAYPSINNHICSFPSSSAYIHDYPHPYFTLYPLPINFMSCPNPLKSSSLFTNVTRCASSYSSHNAYAYGSMKASRAESMCTVEAIAMTSWKFEYPNNVSLSEIHDSLLYGFEVGFCYGCSELFWGKRVKLFMGKDSEAHFLVMSFVCYCFLIVLIYNCSGCSDYRDYLRCALDHYPFSDLDQDRRMCNFSKLNVAAVLVGGLSFPLTIIVGVILLSYLLLHLKEIWINVLILEIAGFIVVAPKVVVCPFVLWFLMYKFRRRHLSVYEAIECFLQSDNTLAPIRYSYSEVKKMTRNFQDKLGQGGYGSVYKGKLRSGHEVAVKLLRESGANGQDFINKTGTIGRIHHVNVVKLVGYCAQGSNRALVFDFMPNGSLEKYLNRENVTSLSWDTKFEIAVGVARGIGYLHQGCDVQILHFDIKPHNILLDHNFTPKISDFGLAKFCAIDKTTVTMTAARGTIGYVALELINRSIGPISYKADVYSFGMLLVEMVGLKEDLIEKNDGSSKYFPDWIYDCFNQGRDIEIGNVDENNDDDSTRSLVRKMTIVALSYAQMNPNDRPSMNKVLEMLEADVESLKIPDYPSQSTFIVADVDENGTSITNDSSSLL